MLCAHRTNILDDVAPVQENIATNISIGNDVIQGEEHEANDEGNFNDPMEVDHDDSNETIHINDGTNQMLQYLYVLGPHYVSFLLYILTPPYLYNHV